MTIAVDFDGVVHGYRHGWRDGTIEHGSLPTLVDEDLGAPF